MLLNRAKESIFRWMFGFSTQIIHILTTILSIFKTNCDEYSRHLCWSTHITQCTQYTRVSGCERTHKPKQSTVHVCRWGVYMKITHTQWVVYITVYSGVPQKREHNPTPITLPKDVDRVYALPIFGIKFEQRFLTHKQNTNT